MYSQSRYFEISSIRIYSEGPLEYFPALALVPVLGNSSDNSSIVFTKLFHEERKLFCSFDVLLSEKSLHMFVEEVGQTWLVSGGCVSITNTMCTGIWFMVNWLWFTKSVLFTCIVSTLHTCQTASKYTVYIATPIMNSIKLLFRSGASSTEY